LVESLVIERPSSTRSADAARWVAVFDALVQGVVTIDAAGVIGSVNPACAEMFGYDEAELIGKNVQVLMPQPDRAQHDQYISNHLTTGEKKIIGIGREVVALKKDGSTFPVHLSIGRYESEGTVGFVGMIQDRSEMVDIQARLAERERTLERHADEARTHRERLERMDRISLAGEMASGIAHEVNQPLSAIANYSRALMHMLEADKLDSSDLKETVDKIRLQSHRAGEIVRRMRDFVSRHSTDPKPISINETVAEVLSFAELSPRGKHVNVDLELGTEIPLVRFDRVQLQQVILNLVNNAVDASLRSRATRIVVRSQVKGSTVTLHVVDGGVGIDAETEAHIFEPFFSSKRHGTGIGLAISRSIVEAQGGTIGFFRNPDRGVTFFFQLPAWRPRSGDE
jgi:two-component system sensor kinase FixL